MIQETFASIWAFWERIRPWCSSAAVRVARATTYPIRCVVFAFVRVVRLFATLVPIFILAVMIYIIVGWTETESMADLYRSLTKFVGDGKQIQFVSTLASVGFFAWALKGLGKAAWTQLREIGSLFKKALAGSWWPEWQIIRSWSEAKLQYCNAREEFPKSFESFAKLVLISFAAVPVTLLLMPATEDDLTHVVVTDVNEAFPRIAFKPVYLEAGSVFSLLHSKDAKMSPPDSGEGVCLDGAKLQWLRAFRAALKQCMRNLPQELDCESSGRPCPVIEVTGYASIAPERNKHIGAKCEEPVGKSYNCKVANLRGLAVGKFLASGEESKPEWMCPNNDDLYWRASVCPKEDCPSGSGAESGYVSLALDADDGKRSIGIRVRQWADERTMKEGKPAADGALPDRRRYRVEVLNRAVHIKILEDFCQAGAMPWP